VAVILNIDTAVEGASVCVANNELLVAEKSNPSKMDSAAWLHLAISDLLKENKLDIKNFDAIAISSGPGSYTGLRVGMAAAKGLCYAAHIPLIMVNTLEIMAMAGKKLATGLLCPMIDARRMEVFTAVYDTNFHLVLPPSNLVLTEESFSDLLRENRLSFFGNGSPKFKQLLPPGDKAEFLEVNYSAADMIELSLNKWKNKELANLAYSEPFYGKEFYSPPPKKKW
jgi:tRNA threonylcarbamoyladenosine biosynthesis protein TsaB